MGRWTYVVLMTRYEIWYNISVGNPEVKENFEDLGADGRITLI
jgi:hypothetical protein